MVKALILSSTLVLAACNATGVKPNGADSESQSSDAANDANPQATSQNAENTSGNQSQAVNPSASSSGNNSSSSNLSTLDTLANRMTAVQDHLLQLRSQTGELQQAQRTLVAQLQAIQTQLAISGGDAQFLEPTEPADVNELNGLLDQITLMVNELSTQTQGGAFHVVSTYTQKGQWVLIRFHRYTGETWLADQGQWNLLEESSTTGSSEYDVVLLRADSDVKGYVASRVDRISGDTWWLKQNTWQPYLDN